MKTKRKRKFWIKFYHHYCPVCGRGYEYRERQYGTRKPKNVYKRHIQVETYDWCDAF